jgi:hypothetical protein
MKLVGRFRVRRLSGLLPPGVSKRIDGASGCTYLFGVPLGRFDVVGRRFVYRRWPVVDELDEPDDTTTGSPWAGVTGAGRLFGRLTFCRFRLERVARLP